MPAKPVTYEPEYGYMYQIFFRLPGDRAWDHCDYAKDTKEKNYLMKEYEMAYQGASLKAFKLPQKYWSAK